MSRGKHVTQGDIEFIHVIHEKQPEWTYERIAEVVGRSPDTVSRVLRCKTKTIEEYDKLQSQLHKPKKAKEQKTEEVSTPFSENYQCNRIHEQLKQQNEKLAVMTEYLRDCARTLNDIKKILE